MSATEGRVLDASGLAWDAETDVAIVGSGIAGSCAAIAAATEGAQTLLVERAATFGGTFAKSAGAFWIPGNSGQSARGVDDRPEETLEFIARCARPTAYNREDRFRGLEPWQYRLVETYLREGASVVRRLEEAGAVTADFPDWAPDYQTKVPENTVKFGRLGIPMSADRSETFTGEKQSERFAGTLFGLGVEVRFKSRADAVIVEDGQVRGIRIQGPSGPSNLRARGGVIFCSGGFTHNRELRRAYLSDTIFGGAAAHGNQGDFVEIATALGLPLFNMHDPWMAPIPLELADDPAVSCVFVSTGDSMVYLNRYGRRVVNEKAPYNEIARVFQTWDPHRLEYPNLLLFMVFDERVRRLWAPPPDCLDRHQRERWSLETLGNYVFDGHHLLAAATLETLAERLADRLRELGSAAGNVGLDRDFVATARRSIEAFNAAALSGVDSEFGRGETPIEQIFFGDRRVGNDLPNPTMHPLSDTGPYYAIILAAGTLDTKGGPRIDGTGSVLDLSGEAVPGLYAAGNCVASPFGQGYPAGGVPNGSALIFGYRAGLHAAERARTTRAGDVGTSVAPAFAHPGAPA